MSGRSVFAPAPFEVGLAWQLARALRGSDDGEQGFSMESEWQAEATAEQAGYSSSCPSGSSTDVYQDPNRQRDLHEQGKCTPCGYFSRKSDGCWKGATCQFCHYCSNNSYQTWKRRDRRLRKREGAVAALRGASPWPEDHADEPGDDKADAMRWQ
eukprot:TRINITY_DN23314_c0_g1_i1.p2 TRINITY_DN23314_c0_g1~~TRINITY_DN23314_c0_g1_i1.p2  ORF type:complete len:155 (-),score=10.01 TRINITY_DN23314_c0_g1_i1:371-835(-)